MPGPPAARDETTAREAFGVLVEEIRAAGDHVGGGADAADGYAYATELLRVALDLYADADGERPRFVPFSTPTTYHGGAVATDRVQGGLNPDALYDFAVLRPDRAYRIRGTRGNDCYLSFSFSGGRDGEWPDRTVATLNDRQIDFAPDGSFEVVVSQDEQPGNWVRMEPDVCSVVVRQYFAIPPSQRRFATFGIEVLGPAADPTPHEDAVARRIGAAAAFIRSTNAHWPLPASPLDNAFTEPLGYTGDAGALGTTDNTYCMGRWHLQPGERLVIETTPIACGYWSLQAWNRWGQSLAHSLDDDATQRRQIVNNETAHRAADGSVRIVLSDTDPGEPNWLDTCGFGEGTLIFRYLYPEARPARPETEVVA